MSDQLEQRLYHALQWTGVEWDVSKLLHDCRDEIIRLRAENERLAGWYDAVIDLLKAEHDKLQRNGYREMATAFTRAMLLIGERNSKLQEAQDD